ncbi:MAG TPA: DUF1206 domain-containing protein [Capillimicrobium sp.]|nr:DUF1206 domain-containing protein [Capillimicrobium sp.]
MGTPHSIRPSSVSRPARKAERGGESFAESREFEWLARAGLAARGVVYGIVGVLAIKLALGDGGNATNQQGALRTIAGGTFGKVLLIVLAVGLAGYAIWRLVRAALGHGPEASDDTKDRIAGVVSGIVYAGLCVTAVQIIAGAGGGERSGHPDDTAAGVLGWTGGTYLVAAAGVAFIGVAIDQAIKGVKRKFLEDSKTEQMSEGVERGFTVLGVTGYLARAVVFSMIGYFLIKAAIDYDPHKAVGVDGALAKLGQASYGPWLLGIVAAGLLAFGLYSFADARYRRV